MPRPLQVEVSCTDSALVAAVERGTFVHIVGQRTALSGGRFRLSFEDQRVDVRLSAGMTPAALLQQLAAALPPGYALTDLFGARRSGGLFCVHRSAQPIEGAPRVEARATVHSLRLQVCEPHVVLLSGQAAHGGFVRLTIDGRAVHVPLYGGESAGVVAQRIAKELPRRLAVDVRSGQTGQRGELTLTFRRV